MKGSSQGGWSPTWMNWNLFALVASVLGDKGILQKLGIFAMKLNTHIFRKTKGGFRGMWNLYRPSCCLTQMRGVDRSAINVHQPQKGYFLPSSCQQPCKNFTCDISYPEVYKKNLWICCSGWPSWHTAKPSPRPSYNVAQSGNPRAACSLNIWFRHTHSPSPR